MARKTFSHLKMRTARLAGDVSDDGITRAGECLNDAQEYIEALRAWSFLKHIEATIELEAGTATYDTPDGMYYASKVYWKQADGTAGTILEPADDDEFVKYYLGVSNDSPTRYRMLGYSSTNNQIRIQVGPPPSANHITNNGQYLYLEQVDTLTELTSDSQYCDLPGEFSKALECLAAALQCQGQGDDQQAASLMVSYGIFMKQLVAKDVKRYGKQFPIVPSITATPYAWRGRQRTGY